MLALTAPQRQAETLVQQFFQQSAGQWRSERRYYTLSSGETQEVISQISIEFLQAQAPDLLTLANLHNLADPAVLVCGAQVSWVSDYVNTKRKPAKGSTIFGVSGNILYRDRGFATPKPVTAQFTCPAERTLCLRTEYGGSVFEEELKLIGQKYRTRQTIISRAGEELMIGQYLETRLSQ